MTKQPTTRQQLYDRIRESSQDEVIIDEMIRLGFWPQAGTLPDDPADEIRQRGLLESRTRELRARARQLAAVDRLKREARQKRMKESKARRVANKERRLAERAARAAAWRENQRTDITYLGHGVSGGLSERTSDSQKLARFDLPHLAEPADLATAMGITIPALRFLSYARAASEKSHYHCFTIAKKSGGRRQISAPMPRLKTAQSWIDNHILAKLPVHEAANGFVHSRSIVTNALPHVGRAVVINVDLKDFFPTVTYPRVKGVFQSLGYSEAIATILALLTTEPNRQQIELDGRHFFVATSQRRLPQGAPSSPAITNRICRRLDHRLTVIAKTLQFRYTRYADDLAFSSETADSGA